jgi:hypothetical protein
VNLFNRQRLCSRQIQRLPINRPSTNTKKSGSYPVDGAKGALAEAIPQFDLVLHQVAVRLPAHVSVLTRKSRGGGVAVPRHGGQRNCPVRPWLRSWDCPVPVYGDGELESVMTRGTVDPCIRRAHPSGTSPLPTSLVLSPRFVPVSVFVIGGRGGGEEEERMVIVL